MEFTTHLELHSQTTRLGGSASWSVMPDSRRGSHPQRRVLPDDFGSGTRRERPYRLQFGRPKTARFSIWALPASLAVTGGILV